MKEFEPMYELREAGVPGSGEFHLWRSGLMVMCPAVGWRTDIEAGAVGGPRPVNRLLPCGTWCAQAEAKTKDGGLIFHQNCVNRHLHISKVVEKKAEDKKPEQDRPRIVRP